MTTVYYYRYYCPTEATYKYTWNSTAPTNCPTDNAVIDPSTITILQTVATNEFTVTDSATGWYQSTALCLTIPGATGTYTQDTSWPCEIVLWTANVFIDPQSAGDDMEILVSPDTAIGYLTATCNTGSTTITVSPTVIAFVQRGLELTLNDGSNVNKLGRITAINTNTSVITFETTTTNTFNMYTPVYISIYIVRDYHICPSMVATHSSLNFAGKGLKGKIIPANTIVRFKYISNTPVAKSISMQVEYFMNG